ncbi:hypothetical protein Airi02_026210 [Actinoallomurus iriomotensis]|uniref:Uncharacterized protein n=1 Tax=Actinoallomurus iriomotensis TaxID=478107 RepID=A0A9W6S305_9ACTN|nr:hypothetical protein Airi02_026210 [Actinoallomurus iriomotensis]
MRASASPPRATTSAAASPAYATPAAGRSPRACEPKSDLLGQSGPEIARRSGPPALRAEPHVVTPRAQRTRTGIPRQSRPPAYTTLGTAGDTPARTGLRPPPAAQARDRAPSRPPALNGLHNPRATGDTPA